MSLTTRQREQLDDLIRETILPAIREDLGINTLKDEKQAIAYIVTQLIIK